MRNYIENLRPLGRAAVRVIAALTIAPIMNHLPGNLEVANAELPRIQEVWSPPRSVQNILDIQDEEDAKDFPSRTWETPSPDTHRFTFPGVYSSSKPHVVVIPAGEKPIFKSINTYLVEPQLTSEYLRSIYGEPEILLTAPSFYLPTQFGFRAKTEFYGNHGIAAIFYEESHILEVHLVDPKTTKEDYLSRWSEGDLAR